MEKENKLRLMRISILVEAVINIAMVGIFYFPAAAIIQMVFILFETAYTIYIDRMDCFEISEDEAEKSEDNSFEI